MSAMAMRLRAWERFAPLSGLLAVALWVIGVVVLETGAGRPDDQATGEQLASYFEDNRTAILTGAFLFMLGCAFFVWFLGALRNRIHEAEGGLGRLPATVFGLGVLLASMMIGFTAPQASGALAAEDERPLSGTAAEALWYAGDGFFVGAIAALAVFFLATAVALLRTGVVPTWLAWATALLAIAALIAPVGWAVLLFGLPLWVLVTSAVIFMRSARAAPDAASPAPVT
jgi:hypothetical protein